MRTGYGERGVRARRYVTVTAMTGGVHGLLECSAMAQQATPVRQARLEASSCSVAEGTAVSGWCCCSPAATRCPAASRLRCWRPRPCARWGAGSRAPAGQGRGPIAATSCTTATRGGTAPRRTSPGTPTGPPTRPCGSTATYPSTWSASTWAGGPLRAAETRAVNSALAIAPWLPDEDVAAPPGNRWKRLAGRQVLIVHGTNDGSAATRSLSFGWPPGRRRRRTGAVCRFRKCTSDGHGAALPG